MDWTVFISVLLLTVLKRNCVGQENNVALRKTATVSSSENNRPAGNAVNGNRNGDYNNDNCVVTRGYLGYVNGVWIPDRSPWWQVDLGRKYPVFKIIVYNRMNYQWRIVPSTITVDGVQCYRYDTTFPDRAASFTCTSTVYGQVVRIQKDTATDANNMDLCEFEVLVCPLGYYGDKCDTRCPGERCEACDQPTGRLCYGCNAGYYGDKCDLDCDSKCKGSCQRDTGSCILNVAEGQSASLSSQDLNSGPAGNAVNGDTASSYPSNCIETANWLIPNQQFDYAPWWQVDLGRKYPVYRITIYTRTNYENSLTPSTVTVDGQRCFRYDSIMQTISCDSTIYGQVVRIERDHKQSSWHLSFCEIQVLVCLPGFSGSSCNQSCSLKNCGYCDQDNAFICYECKAGHRGTDCNNPCLSYNCLHGECDRQSGLCAACLPGKWGHNCDQSCPTGCDGTDCDPKTGHCLACPQSYWGNSCSSPCLSTTCKDNRCHVKNGTCIACSRNLFQLPYCECSDYYYLKDSNCEPCRGQCYSNAPCNKTTGYCARCPPGRQGDDCQLACTSGTYGQDCKEACGQCAVSGCDQTTGHCIGYCKDGWVRPFCKQKCGECADGASCDQYNGRCQKCAPGKKDTADRLCTIDCDDGRFGQGCSGTCGRCAGAAICDKVTGSCTSCQTGLQPPLCQQNCSRGLYGDGCAKECGHCQEGDNCHHESGQCPGECASGYTGVYCAALQQSDDGGGGSSVVIGGVVGGVIIAVIIAAIVVVVVLRRRKRSPKPAYSGVSEELSERRNGLHEPSDSNVHGSSLSFEPIVVTSPANSTATTFADKPQAAVKPQVKAKPPRTSRDKNAIYENMALGKTAPSEQSESASPTLPPKDKKGKKPKAKPIIGDDTPEECLTDDEGVADDSLYANQDTYYNVDPASLSLDSLQRQLLNKLKARDKLDAEFQKIPVADENAAKVNGEREENYLKNRFNSILPYDRNRVALDKIDGDDASDYINASFVRGRKSDKAYIAAQGPKNNTVDDFWRMVWKENVTRIVMLTNLQEQNKWKCFEYWPAKGTKKIYGAVEVVGVDQEQRAHYVIRTFNITQSGSKETRRVHQYQYISWLDHEVPSTTHLVDFWQYVRTRCQSDKSPLLVHCSAGVGRTGTFIGLDIVIDQAQHETNVSIHDVVRRMRDDRCNMVQNKGQYVFLHEAVLEAYTSLNTRLDMQTFDSVFGQPVESGSPHQRIDKEFETLRQMRACFTRPVYNNATMEENCAKNRNPNALPDDRHLVYLTSHVHGRNQYINAVFMSTFREARGSILTQLPLPDTLMDIWRLVDGCKVNTIVAIGDVKIKQNGSYWPRGIEETITTGIYTVALKSATKLGSSLTTYTVSLILQDKPESRSVKILHYEDWAGDVPTNTKDMLHLLDVLENTKKERAGHPFLVQCIDGAAKSGLFCVLHNVMSRVMQDEEADVYLAVRHLQSVRPEAVASVEQYCYCYELIQQYRNSHNVYANA